MPKVLVLLFLVILLPFWGEAQDQLPENEYHYHFYNGLDIYFIDIKTDPLITLSLTIKTGVFADEDSLHGISYEYHCLFSKKLSAWAKTAGATYSTNFEHDHVTYIFQFPPEMIDKVLEELYDNLSVVENAHPADLPAAMPVDSDDYNLPGSFIEQGKKMLWGDFYLRATLAADSLPRDTNAIRLVHEHYFGADNALMVIRGNFVNRELYPKVQINMAGWKSRKHNYFLESPVPQPKDLKLSRQFVDSSGNSAKPVIMVWLRGPSSFQDKEYAMLAPLLDEVLKISSMSKAFTDTSHITKLDFHVENGRYSSQVVVRMEPDSINPDSAYHNLFQYFVYTGQGRMFSTDDVEKAKANLLERYNKTVNDPISQANLIAYYWNNFHYNNYSLYPAELKAITIEQLCAFTHKYMQDQPFIAGLYISKEKRASMKTDSFFTPTKAIEDYRFVFTRNNADLSDSVRDELNSLAQTIKINPKLKVMINGVAGKDELLHINDSKMFDFMRDHPGFAIASGELATTKKFRLDVYRALTVVKALVDLGVPENQLSGTGKIVDKDGMIPLPDQQVYCTINQF